MLARSWPFRGSYMLLSLHWTRGFCLCVESLHSSQYAAKGISAWLLSRTLPQHCRAPARCRLLRMLPRPRMLLSSGPMIENRGKGGHAAVRLPMKLIIAGHGAPCLGCCQDALVQLVLQATKLGGCNQQQALGFMEPAKCAAYNFIIIKLVDGQEL